MIYSGDIILSKLAGQHQHMFAKVEVFFRIHTGYCSCKAPPNFLMSYQVDFEQYEPLPLVNPIFMHIMLILIATYLKVL